MNEVFFTDLEEWDDFGKVQDALLQLGWKIVDSVEGPDAQVGFFTKAELGITLVFNDMLGLSLKGEVEVEKLNEIITEVEDLFDE